MSVIIVTLCQFSITVYTRVTVYKSKSFGNQKLLLLRWPTQPFMLYITLHYRFF